MAGLTGHEVQQLVALRLALEAANRQATTAIRYRRGAAVVALDAAVERACAMVTLARGLTVPSNGKLDDLISRLKESLGPAWNPTVLPDIRQLRRARNAAQHEGLEPDREQLPLWASAVHVLVTSLVQAQYDVDVRNVTLADAVRDDELRAILASAESSRDLGDAGQAVRSAAQAYRLAARQWKRLRAYDRRSTAVRHYLSPTRDTDAEVALLQAALEAGTFSADAGEAEWFVQAISERDDVLDLDDADRAVSFAFQWILGYETAAATWVRDRRHRAAVKARLVRSLGDQPARIDACTGVTLQQEWVTATFRLRDVPDPEAYEEWAEQLREALAAPSGHGMWDVNEDGTVQLTRRISDVGVIKADTEVLAAALLMLERRVNEAAAEAVRARDEQAAKKSAHDASIQLHPDPWPTWVEGISWEPRQGGYSESERWVLRVTPGAARVRIGSRPDGPDSRDRITDLLRRNELVAQCYGVGSAFEIALEPLLSPPELHGVLTKADPEIARALAAEAAHDAALASRRRRLLTEISSVIEGQAS